MRLRMLWRLRWRVAAVADEAERRRAVLVVEGELAVEQRASLQGASTDERALQERKVPLSSTASAIEGPTGAELRRPAALLPPTLCRH